MSDSASLINDPALAECSEVERLFVLAFIAGPTFANATRSAEAAGVNASTPASLRAQAYQIKKRTHVQSAIRELLNRQVITKEEAMARLSDIVRGPLNQLAEVIEHIDQDGEFFYDLKLNVARAVKEGRGHLIKELKETVHTNQKGETTRTITVKMPDPLQALRLYLNSVSNEPSPPVTVDGRTPKEEFLLEINNMFLNSASRSSNK